MCESTDHCQEFPIVHVVIAFCQVQGLRIVSYRLEFTPIVPLIQNHSQHILRGVHLQFEWSVVVGAPQHGVARDYRLKGVDGLGTFQHPHKGHILLGEVLDWSNYVHIPLDEGAIVSK